MTYLHWIGHISELLVGSLVLSNDESVQLLCFHLKEIGFVPFLVSVLTDLNSVVYFLTTFKSDFLLYFRVS